VSEGKGSVLAKEMFVSTYFDFFQNIHFIQNKASRLQLLGGGGVEEKIKYAILSI